MGEIEIDGQHYVDWYGLLLHCDTRYTMGFQPRAYSHHYIIM